MGESSEHANEPVHQALNPIRCKRDLAVRIATHNPAARRLMTDGVGVHYEADAPVGGGFRPLDPGTGSRAAVFEGLRVAFADPVIGQVPLAPGTVGADPTRLDVEAVGDLVWGLGSLPSLTVRCIWRGRSRHHPDSSPSAWSNGSSIDQIRYAPGSYLLVSFFKQARSAACLVSPTRVVGRLPHHVSLVVVPLPEPAALSLKVLTTKLHSSTFGCDPGTMESPFTFAKDHPSCLTPRSGGFDSFGRAFQLPLSQDFSASGLSGHHGSRDRACEPDKRGSKC